MQIGRIRLSTPLQEPRSELDHLLGNLASTIQGSSTSSNESGSSGMGRGGTLSSREPPQQAINFRDGDMGSSYCLVEGGAKRNGR